MSFFQDYLNAKATKNLLHTNKGITSDINFSNIGRYPFDPKYPVADSSLELSVESFYVYNNNPGFGPASIIWSTSVKSMRYSMMSKFSSSSDNTFFKNWVKISENIGTISSDETLLQVYERLFHFHKTRQ